eukprot:4455903-Amphidinium_carterae.1
MPLSSTHHPHLEEQQQQWSVVAASQVGQTEDPNPRQNLPRKAKTRSVEQVSPLPVRGASSAAAAAVRKSEAEAMFRAQARAQAAEAAWHDLGMRAGIEMSEQQAHMRKMHGELEVARNERVQGAMQSGRERVVAEEAAMMQAEQSIMQERIRSEQATGTAVRQVEHKAAREHEIAMQGLAVEAERELRNRMTVEAERELRNRMTLQVTEAERVRGIAVRESMEAQSALTAQGVRHGQELEQMREMANSHFTRELERVKTEHGQEVSILTKQLERVKTEHRQEVSILTKQMEEMKLQMTAIQMSAGARPSSDDGAGSSRWKKIGGGPPPGGPFGSCAGEWKTMPNQNTSVCAAAA